MGERGAIYLLRHAKVSPRWLELSPFSSHRVNYHLQFLFIYSIYSVSLVLRGGPLEGLSRMLINEFYKREIKQGDSQTKQTLIDSVK